ncbi:hypothetical protein ACQP0C_37510 [Nocardia sp. CA-129566]|uniref:hypothetical protein n=1 Tax=Nocardia sp. CA-129566 TaxID=3239976 RepID=UPI003D9613D0
MGISGDGGVQAGSRSTAFGPGHQGGVHRSLAAGAGIGRHPGDLAALRELLSEDVVAYNDGGGKVRAALEPIVGIDAVLAFVTWLRANAPLDGVRTIEVNGEPAVVTRRGEHEQVLAIDIRAGRIHALYGILNPEKLAHVQS